MKDTKYASRRIEKEDVAFDGKYFRHKTCKIKEKSKLKRNLYMYKCMSCGMVGYADILIKQIRDQVSMNFYPAIFEKLKKAGVASGNEIKLIDGRDELINYFYANDLNADIYMHFNNLFLKCKGIGKYDVYTIYEDHNKNEVYLQYVRQWILDPDNQKHQETVWQWLKIIDSITWNYGHPKSPWTPFRSKEFEEYSF
ncbi:MAG: hypothetical protein INQ03_04755 [Candidatus Heimdallarchaeota archaeon]|nr:hypothetical protein [Candidatus Heimdallarchaeota archaeon]